MTMTMVIARGGPPCGGRTRPTARSGPQGLCRVDRERGVRVETTPNACPGFSGNFISPHAPAGPVKRARRVLLTGVTQGGCLYPPVPFWANM